MLCPSSIIEGGPISITISSSFGQSKITLSHVISKMSVDSLFLSSSSCKITASAIFCNLSSLIPNTLHKKEESGEMNYCIILSTRIHDLGSKLNLIKKHLNITFHSNLFTAKATMRQIPAYKVDIGGASYPPRYTSEIQRYLQRYHHQMHRNIRLKLVSTIDLNIMVIFDCSR